MKYDLNEVKITQALIHKGKTPIKKEDILFEKNRQELEKLTVFLGL